MFLPRPSRFRRLFLPFLLLLPVLSGLAWYSGYLERTAYRLMIRSADNSGKSLGLEAYQVSIDALPIAGITRNASGLTWHPGRNSLFAVINQPAQVVELSPDGVLKRTVPVSGVADLEGITTGPRCSNALCIKRTGRQDFWNNASDNTTEGVDVTLTQMMSTTVGARYGQYTGAEIGSASNPILREQGTTANELKRGGWYWIEVLPYDADAGNSALIAGGITNLALNLQPNVVYRITAVAHGRKLRREGSADVPVTQVVLQQTYARQKYKD